jgi:DNA polymerase
VRIVFDLETTSTQDLRKTGAHAYAEHPDTRITVLCFAIDNGPVKTWTGGPIPWIFNKVMSEPAAATIVAHNYLFEFNLYHQKLVPEGWPPIPLTHWSCTMARSLVAGYPASLDLVGRALGLTNKKDHSARDLMLRFARPRSLNPTTWWHETDPVRFQALCDYCAQDVLTERELDRRVPELSQRERLIFELDHWINQEGLGIDHLLVGELAVLTQVAQDRLTRGIADLTKGQVRSLGQVAQLRDWLNLQGVETPDLRRGTVQALLPKTPAGPARTALQARLDASRSSTAKLASIASARSQDGRLRGTFQYYGAARTGRWAGRRFQPQNLFRGSIKDVPAALDVIRAGAGPEDLELLFEDSALGVVASCMRSTIVARPGHRLVIADFSQIEARVLAWLAGQYDALKIFSEGKDIYVETARAIGSANRQLGKVLVLACGFGMGHARFQQTALGYGVILDEDEAAAAVTAWREVNHRIVTFWWETHRALMRVLRAGPGATERAGYVTLLHRPGVMLIRLPSARHLVYRHPKIEVNDKGFDEFTYMGSLGGGWLRLRAWPGKIAENITQAVARDVMAEAMLQMRGAPLIATIHDELISEVSVDEADDTLGAMLGIMRKAPSWAPGLPVDAAGFVVRRYQKG